MAYRQGSIVAVAFVLLVIGGAVLWRTIRGSLLPSTAYYLDSNVPGWIGLSWFLISFFASLWLEVLFDKKKKS